LSADDLRVYRAVWMLVEIPRARGEVPTVDSTMGVILMTILILWLLGVRIF
jgi:hypothetical protein